jgi:hypothetical protein
VEPPSELVATIDDVTSNQTTPEAKSSSSQIDWGALSAFAALTIGIAPIWLFRKRNLLVRRFFKIAAVLLCLLPVSLVLFPIASVCATYPYSRATIWGSESIGAWDDRLGYQVSWRKAPWEVSQQQSTAINIADRFDFNGYNADNYQGSHGQGSMKYAILDQIWINEANYPRVAVVDFDHGNGNAGINGIPEFPGIPEDEFHYMFEDNFGVHDGTPENPGPVLHSHAVYDMEIYNKTAFNKTFFAFMNTCNSAHVDDWYNGQYPSGQGIIPGTSRARGMPFAWTHRSVGQIGPGFNTNQNMSDDGYNNADGGNFVYIGFVGGSASLSQTLSGSWPYYHTWLEQFFGYALIYDMSVKDALDHASYSLWPGYCFDQTPLRAGNGFWAIWEVWNPSEGWHNLMGGSWGKMAVYGNGNIRLYQYQLTVNALDQYGSAVPGVEVYMDGVTLGQAGNSWKIVPTSHQLQVSVPIGYTFQYFEGYPSGQNPITVQLNSDYMTVTARYYITPVSLTIQNNYGLYYTVPAVGTHWYNYGTDVQVWAYPLSHWVFTHWHLDGSDYTTMNPCWVNMYDDHVLRPIFQYSP